MGAIVEFFLVALGAGMLLWLMFLGCVAAYRFFAGRAETERRAVEARKRVAEMLRNANDKKKKK